MSLRRHGKLAPRIREAIGRVVKSLEIGEDGYDLAAVQFVTTAVSREESLDFERRFIDDIVEAVGRVLVDELGSLTDADRERLGQRVGWLEQGLRLAVSDLERSLGCPKLSEFERITEQLRKTIEGPANGATAGTSRELGPCYPGSPDDERGPL